MPRALGLANPANASKGGAFKEGLVRIDSNSYKVHQSKGEDAVPTTKWSWIVTRLDEEQKPLLNEQDEPIIEELLFGFGGKALPFVHPGKCETLEDEDAEDMGTSVGGPDSTLSEGNTIFLQAPDWKPNEKCGLMVLTKSLTAQNVNVLYLNRCWAPDWNGCIFYMKSELGGKTNDGKDYNQKVVTKVLVGPGGGKAKSGKASGKPNDAEATIGPILHALSAELDGQSLTRKAFLNRVRAALEAAKTDAKLLVPVLGLCKDDKWLEGHGETFDYFLDPANQTITFGKLPV